MFLFSGDFCQVLPVVKRGHPTTIIESCLKSLPQWSQFHKLYLTRNMRAIEDSYFRDWLIKLGNSKLYTKHEFWFSEQYVINFYFIVYSYSIAVLLAAESSDRSAGVEVEFHWHMVCGMQ